MELDCKLSSSSSKVHHIPAFLVDLQICIKNESTPDKNMLNLLIGIFNLKIPLLNDFFKFYDTCPMKYKSE